MPWFLFRNSSRSSFAGSDRWDFQTTQPANVSVCPENVILRAGALYQPEESRIRRLRSFARKVRSLGMTFSSFGVN
jgi:hypothetical protein